MRIYPDTSFFFSLYATDSNSPSADAWRHANPLPLPFTAFHRLELRNALGLAAFRKHLMPQEIQAAWQGMENDLAAGILVPRIAHWHRILREAEHLAENHTPSVGCRSLDIIHVAAASVLGISEFCTFDTRQADLARRAGLSVSTL